MKKLKRSECAVLTLILKRKWYDMIASGEKRKEYRDDTPRYRARFRNFQDRCRKLNIDILGKVREGTQCAVVAFSLGYTKATMFYTIRFQLAEGEAREAILPGGGEYWAAAVIRNGSSHPDWGEPETPHYVIALGERVELEDL